MTTISNVVPSQFDDIVPLSQKPSQDDRDALKSYFHLFSRLYPCGECAAEFQMLLKEYPPQVSAARPSLLLFSSLSRFSSQYLFVEISSTVLTVLVSQTSSRKSASMWLCFVHNLINERLGKPEFDCLTLDETYDCGCGPEGALALGSATAPATESHV